MVVTKLIEKLKLLENTSKPLFASLNEDTTKKYFVDVFGNSCGLPTISISEDEPLPANKDSSILLEELKRWRTDSTHYNPDTDLYLIANYEYEDESYDIRYFKLEEVVEKGNDLILIAASNESVELREHYEAFDDDMLAED